MANDLTINMIRKMKELEDQYDKGEINQEELSDILELLIYSEASKPDAEINGAWLDACTKRMLELDKFEMNQYFDYAEETRQAVQNKLPQEVQSKMIRFKPAIWIAACLVLFLGVGAMGHFAWIQTEQIQENQIYRLQGYEVIYGEEAEAAETDIISGTCQTDDFSEICSFLGYTPAIPQWLPDGWAVNCYSVSRDENQEIFRVSYTNQAEDYLLSYNQIRAYDVSALEAEIPQDTAGQNLDLENGLKVYLTTNTNRVVAVWTTNSSYEYISGPISQEELINVILHIE